MKKNTLLPTTSNRLITKPVLYTSVFLLLAICLLPLASSTTPTIHLPENTVTMIVTDGTTAYFDITLSDVPSGFDVKDGSYKGWCADRSTVMPRGETLTVKLYSSSDPSLPWHLREKNWSKVNYILNHHDGVTKTDIQDAIWYLLCQYPSMYLSSTAKQLADNAQNGFVPAPGEWIAIPAEPIQNDSQPWPFQVAFLQVTLPSQEPTEPDEPDQPDEPEQPDEPIQTTVIHSHGLHYNDVAPTASTNGPYTGFAKESIEFNGAASMDPDGIIISYHWSFGDGATSEDITTAHSYSHAGVYQVRLTIRDNFGLSDTDVTNATISTRNNPPTLLISGPVNGSTNTEYAYTFVASDPDNDEISYQVDWGDGTSIQTGTAPSGQVVGLSHRWNSSGTYAITVTASDGSLLTVSEKDIVIKETIVAENIWILGLALLAIIALLAILLYSKKAKNTN